MELGFQDLPDDRDFEKKRKYQCGDIKEKWVQAANTNP